MDIIQTSIVKGICEKQQIKVDWVNNSKLGSALISINNNKIEVSTDGMGKEFARQLIDQLFKNITIID